MQVQNYITLVLVLVLVLRITRRKKQTRKKFPQPQPPPPPNDIDMSTPPRRLMKEEETPFGDLSPASAYHASVALQQQQLQKNASSASVPRTSTTTTTSSHPQRPRKGIKTTMSTPPRRNEETPWEDLSPASAYHGSVALQQLQKNASSASAAPTVTHIESSANMSMNTIRKQTKSIFTTPPRPRPRRRSRAKEGTCTSRTQMQTEKQSQRQDHSLSPASAYHASARLQQPPHAHTHEQNFFGPEDSENDNDGGNESPIFDGTFQSCYMMIHPTEPQNQHCEWFPFCDKLKKECGVHHMKGCQFFKHRVNDAEFVNKMKDAKNELKKEYKRLYMQERRKAEREGSDAESNKRQRQSNI